MEIVNNVRMKKWILWLWGAIVVGCLLLVMSLWQLGDGMLHISYLNIGQGDAALVRTPGRQYVLIDGGPGDAVLGELAGVMPFFARRIDVVMLSHPHADHLDGLIEVLERYDVGVVMMTGVSYGYKGYERFLEVIEERDVEVIFVNGEVDYLLDDVVLDIVYPFESLAGRAFENVNNSSISFRLLYGERSFYFSGDLEVEGEEALVASTLDVRSDVLKAGHHGSRTSSSEPLLDLVQPLWAVISCGVDNQFLHPHAETITHFQKRGVTIYRTDLDGRVELKSDGMKIFWGV